jgi:antitoxin MazE
MGNSQGVIIPKPVLAQVGLEHEAEMVVEKDAIVLRKPAAKAHIQFARAGAAGESTMGDQEAKDPLRKPA